MVFHTFRYEDDKSMVNALLLGNEGAIRYVFFDHFRPLLENNARKTCGGKHVEYDDLVQELYLYLSGNDWAKLKLYNPSMPFINWFSVVSYRFFKDYSRSLIDLPSEMPISDMNDHNPTLAQAESSPLMNDLLRVLPLLKPPRDGQILKDLLVDDEEPESVVRKFGVTVDNLYNIKRRALVKLVNNYLNDYK